MIGKRYYGAMRKNTAYNTNKEEEYKEPEVKDWIPSI
jgi:hypothetical protein